MKILMVVFHYPPLNQMASSRSYAFAKYWSKMGHHVTVVTPKKYSYHGKLNYTPSHHADIKLIEVQYAKWLTKRFDVETSMSEKSVSGVRKIIRFLRKHLIGNAFDTQRLWERAVFKEADRLLREKEFDILFSSFSPPTPHLIASKLKAKYPQLFWVADYRDLWNGNHLLQIHQVLGLFEKKRERRVLQKADLIVTVSEGFKNYLEAFHKKKVYTIFNGYDHEEIQAAAKEPFFSQDQTIRFVYTGTIYIGTRDPTPFFQAIKMLDDEGVLSPQKCEIWFFGDSANVLEIAQRVGITPYVHIGGYISKEDAYRAQRDATGLLFLEEQTQNSTLSAQGTIPAKLYEMLMAKTEIFAIGLTEDSFAGRLIKESRTGDCYAHDSMKVYDRLKALIKENKRVIEPNQSLIEQFSRVYNAKKLIKLIEDCR